MPAFDCYPYNRARFRNPFGLDLKPTTNSVAVELKPSRQIPPYPLVRASLMDSDRRESQRVWADILVEWHGLLGSHSGHISDISLVGCFILAGGEVTPGELIAVEIDLPGLLRMHLWGKVIYHIADMGFALRFKDLSVTDSTLLSRLIEYFQSGRHSLSNP